GEGGGSNRGDGEGEAGAEHAFVPNFLRGQSKARKLHLAIKTASLGLRRLLTESKRAGAAAGPF
ncbi:hypothetical protein, partial [Bradyrhizobium elkanii]|uniref:hypothetical protein n=1 Tax=Bradyrhizobium elkanii TaxID=29448 RepID=UPI001AEC0B88